jgi:GAF domain-containing protein
MTDHSSTQTQYLYSDKNPNPVLAISAEAEVIYRNPASIEQWSWLAGGATVTLPEDWPAIVSQALETNESIEIEYERDGQIFSCTFAPIIAAHCVTVYGYDITKHKRIETEFEQRNRELLTLQVASAAVSSSLDLYHVIEAVTNEMIYLLDVDGCVLYEWNQAEDTISLMDEYSSKSSRDRGKPGETFSLEDYPRTRQVLLERRARHITLDQPDISPAEWRYMQKAHVQTLLILPMIFQDNVIGLAEMVAYEKQTFSDQAIMLAQLLANQATSAIENARLYERVHQRVNELAILSNISQAINSTLDLQEMMSTITDLTTHLIGAEATSVALYDDSDRGSLWYVAASGEGADFVQGERLALGQGITGWVVEHGEAVVIPDVSQDPRFLDKFDQVSHFTTRSMICAPLKLQGETIGAISTINKKSGSFTENDLHLLNSLAASAAIAIEHARLYKQAQQEISERKQAEAALATERALLTQRIEERTAELSAANVELSRVARLKDELLARMSHELRAPLLAILEKIEMLQNLVYGPLNERQLNSLKSIEQNEHHLLSLINDILYLSNIKE